MINHGVEVEKIGDIFLLTTIIGGLYCNFPLY